MVRISRARVRSFYSLEAAHALPRPVCVKLPRAHTACFSRSKSFELLINIGAKWQTDTGRCAKLFSFVRVTQKNALSFRMIVIDSKKMQAFFWMTVFFQFFGLSRKMWKMNNVICIVCILCKRWSFLTSLTCEWILTVAFFTKLVKNRLCQNSQGFSNGSATLNGPTQNFGPQSLKKNTKSHHMRLNNILHTLKTSMYE